MLNINRMHGGGVKLGLGNENFFYFFAVFFDEST